MTLSESREKLNILLVEDDSVDAQVVHRAFRDHHQIASIIHVRDGREALDRLRGDDGEDPLALPFLILLDLKMPGMNGHKFLECLREDACLGRSVVFVLTTSKDGRDILQAYDRAVAGYLLKEDVGRDLEMVRRLVEVYWKAVQFPMEDN